MDLKTITCFLTLLPFVFSDNFRFASHYADHMVLQRGPSHAVLWGFGEKGALVNISHLRKTYETDVVQDSRGLSVWKVVLDPVYASGPYQIYAESTLKGKTFKISLQDVLFGDVWICGGQSNMQFTTGMAFNGSKEIAIAARYTQIRLFTIKRYNSEQTIPELDRSNILQQWSVANKASVGGPGWQYFSAVCWMYGRRLYDLYKVPIGLISTNYGGTSDEAWSSPKTLAKCGITKNASPKRNDPNMHSGLWNAMIYPLLNTTIYGVIWYQGEQNAYKPQTYNCTFPALIRGWREEWFDGTHGYSNYYFPFGFVQLSALGNDERIDGFPIIRWKQTAEYGYAPNPKQLHTFMAVTMDLLDSKSPVGSIHPRDKTTVAERLLLGARAIAYKENIYWTGPIADRVEVVVLSNETNIVVVHYKESSLQSDGIQVRHNSGFEVTFNTSITNWVPVDITTSTRSSVSMRINQTAGKTVSGVRYAWNQKPCSYKLCAVYASNSDLPSPPFIKHAPFKVTHHWTAIFYKIYNYFVSST